MADNPFQDLIDRESNPTVPTVPVVTSNPFQDLLDREQTSSGTSTARNPFQDLLESEEVRVTVDDPDSFTSRVGRSFNQFQKSFAEGVGVYARERICWLML